jgi:hypothetical protein
MNLQFVGRADRVLHPPLMVQSSNQWIANKWPKITWCSWPAILVLPLRFGTANELRMGVMVAG